MKSSKTEGTPVRRPRLPRNRWLRRRWWFLIGAVPGVVAFSIVSPDAWWSLAVICAVVVLMFVIMFTLLSLRDVMTLDQPRPTPTQFRAALRKAILLSIFLVFVLAILLSLLVPVTR